MDEQEKQRMQYETMQRQGVIPDGYTTGKYDIDTQIQEEEMERTYGNEYAR